MIPASSTRTPASLPSRYRDAALRGLRGHCPRCDAPGMFRKWLKPVDSCRVCGQAWSIERADDFPAYIAIFVTGHLLAPVMIMLIRDAGLSAWATLAILLPVALVMMLAILQPAKGGVLASMWWSGMGTFTKERPVGHPDHPDSP